jgi:hypothetical protein
LLARQDVWAYNLLSSAPTARQAVVSSFYES